MTYCNCASRPQEDVSHIGSDRQRRRWHSCNNESCLPGISVPYIALFQGRQFVLQTVTHYSSDNRDTQIYFSCFKRVCSNSRREMDITDNKYSNKTLVSGTLGSFRKVNSTYTTHDIVLQATAKATLSNANFNDFTTISSYLSVSRCPTQLTLS